MGAIGDILKSKSKDVDPIVSEVSIFKQLIKETGQLFQRSGSLSEKLRQGRMDMYVPKIASFADGHQFQAHSLADEAVFLLLWPLPASKSTFRQSIVTVRE